MANPTLCSFAFFVLFFVNSSFALFPHNQRPDDEFVSSKNNCYNDIDSGLWGEKCRASMIDRENCALWCLSPVCYEILYQHDPLEKGERDHVRRQEFRHCMQTDTT